MNATKYIKTRAPKGWDTYLEVEFSTRDGQTRTVTGPIGGAHLTTGTKPRRGYALHDKTTAQAVEVCHYVGLEFWAVKDRTRHYWAVKDGQFFRVHNVIQRAIVTVTPVDAWGTATGETVEHPAGRWS